MIANYKKIVSFILSSFFFGYVGVVNSLPAVCLNLTAQATYLEAEQMACLRQIKSSRGQDTKYYKAVLKWRGVEKKNEYQLISVEPDFVDTKSTLTYSSQSGILTIPKINIPKAEGTEQYFAVLKLKSARDSFVLTKIDAYNNEENGPIVRKTIPNTPALDNLYPPMSRNKGPRWDYIKTQYNTWYHRQAPSYNGGIRGGGKAEAWRYDPMKTLIELCRRAELVGDKISGVCEDAKDTIAEFFSRQYWGTKGKYPDCSGGILGLPKGQGQVNKCDFKYGGHASALHYATELYGQTPYTIEQKEMLKEFCYTTGWNGQVFTERDWGIALQCLIDLQKQDVDTSTERKDLMTRLFAKFTADENVGAPLHGMNSHEGTSFSPDPQMFSPWMGGGFLIPALWEHWVFLEKDPRIAQIIVMYGDAMMKYAIVNPEVWAPKEPWNWKLKRNPTEWLTLYYAIPNDKKLNIKLQGADGSYSDYHNPESIFVLNAAYFFSCNEAFKRRSEAMNPFFNQPMALSNTEQVTRVFLWQHRGSASTEWLLENAKCTPTS